jgi:hypothetical protein
LGVLVGGRGFVLVHEDLNRNLCLLHGKNVAVADGDVVVIFIKKYIGDGVGKIGMVIKKKKIFC